MISSVSYTRREVLSRLGGGFGGLALGSLLNAAEHSAPTGSHFPPKATAVIQLFMQGGPSHIDLLDPKPLLEKYDGKPFPGTIKYDNAAQASSRVLASPWKFHKHGQSGIEVSELLPNLAEIIDDVCVIRSM